MHKSNYIKSIFILISIFISHSSFSQSNWTWVSPSPQGNDLYTLHLFSGNELIAGGDCGTVIRTTNTGNNWSVINKISGTSETIRYYYKYDNNNVFLGTGGGKILKSTNGGINFAVSCNLNGSAIFKIQMLDLNTGYACDAYKFYKTTNGGINWNTLLTVSYNITSFVCFNQTNCIISCYMMESPAVLKRTTNGGVNWIDTVLSGGTLRVENTTNSTTAIAYYIGKIMKTTNMGVSWITMNPSTQIILSALCVIDENNLFGANNNYFYISTNGGVNWIQKIFPQYLPNSPVYIAFSGPATGYVLGWNNKIFYTSNAGDNWSSISQANGSGSSSNWLQDYWFLDNNTGFITGRNNTFLKTTDAGSTFNQLVSPFGSSIRDICFVNNVTGYVIGNNPSGINVIAKTTNSGVNWFITDSLSGNQSANKVAFFNASTGIVTALYDQMYRTTDGGYNWSTVLPVNLYSVNDICTLNSNTGFVSGNMQNSEDRIYKTTDAGSTWFQVFGGNGQYNATYKMKFINSSTGYGAGYNILKTTNGGTNWFQVNAPVSSFCSSIEIVNDVMYVTTYGAVYKSTNAGLIWGTLDIPTTERIEFAMFFNENTGIIAGNNNIILKTTNGGGNFSVNINNNGSNIANDYYLSQNYPNPFNPVTRIKFSIPENINRINRNGIVTLKVYDILGKEVETLVNESLQPGTYEVTFDGSALNSGVYFYQLSINNERLAAKKMLLIK
jgi:photosystem II stability/assembly factor-like uncharacterized protein